MKDYEIVALARRLEKMRIRWFDLLDAFPDHVRDALADNYLEPFASPEAVVHDCLAHPERWECGDRGIRRKRTLDE